MISTCAAYSNFGIILQSVIEFGGRLSCSCDGSTSGTSSSGSVLSAPLAVVVGDGELVVCCCWEFFGEFFKSFFCCFKNASK